VLLNIADLEADFIHESSFKTNKGDNTVSFEIMELEIKRIENAAANIDNDEEALCRSK
jgi:hypothetical protein